MYSSGSGSGGSGCGGGTTDSNLAVPPLLLRVLLGPGHQRQ